MWTPGVLMLTQSGFVNTEGCLRWFSLILCRFRKDSFFYPVVQTQLPQSPSPNTNPPPSHFFLSFYSSGYELSCWMRSLLHIGGGTSFINWIICFNMSEALFSLPTFCVHLWWRRRADGLTSETLLIQLACIDIPIGFMSCLFHDWKVWLSFEFYLQQ